MQSEIFVRNIQKMGNRMSYEFDYSDDLRAYFNPTEQFFIEYLSLSKSSLESVSDSILIIPFLCNVLPIAWVFDAVIYVESLDKSFYESIPEFKNGYINMYPNINFSGDIIVNKIIENSYNHELPGKNLAFFSGGVDSFNTLVSHHKENLVLMTLWGSDIFFDDIKGWNNVVDHVAKTTEQFGLEYSLIKSNFRKFLNEGILSKFVIKKAGDGWWHGFQHGIGLIGHAAPLTYLYNIGIIYIASTFTVAEAGKVTCASDPTIDNRVKIADSKVIHDGYEFNRQNKIKNICEFVNKKKIPIKLRVCWISSGGENCCQCEKCYRTIMGVLAEGYDPNNFGLSYSKDYGHRIKFYIKYKVIMNVEKNLWKDIQRQFSENYKVIKSKPELKWILNIAFDKINKSPIKVIYNLTNRVINKLKRIILQR